MGKENAKYRRLLPDPKYGDELVASFVNNLMMHGKKSLAFKIFYSAMDKVGERIEEEKPLDVFKKALDNVTPTVEVRSRRVGGATFQIPREVPPNRRISLAMKWIIRYARGRNEKSMEEKLAQEIMSAYREEGGAFKKKEDTHKMAESNKAFSHFKF